MARSVKAPAGTGVMFHKTAIAVLIAGATGMFAVGALTKIDFARQPVLVRPCWRNRST